jgi:hypothetical protein
MVLYNCKFVKRSGFPLLLLKVFGIVSCKDGECSGLISLDTLWGGFRPQLAAVK